MEVSMKTFARGLFAVVVLMGLVSSAEAQWGRRYYQPMWVSPQPVVVHRPVMVQPAPVMVAPQPVRRVYRRPVVTYHPTTVVTTRHRPILGGTVVHTRPGYKRVIW
jgi:hypothetical protein